MRTHGRLPQRSTLDPTSVAEMKAALIRDFEAVTSKGRPDMSQAGQPIVRYTQPQRRRMTKLAGQIRTCDAMLRGMP